MKRPDYELDADATRGERTRELTGWDATMDEAQAGDAGNGADPYGGGDFTGGMPRPIEDEPDRPDDIVPDRIERWPGLAADEERELTAQPHEPMPVDPSEV